MNPERWQRIKDAFSAALEIPPEQRADWLSLTLPDDPSLAAEVKKLLAACSTGATIDDFYERGALAAVPEVQRQLEEPVEGMRLGPYRVLSELGRGGMGAVYLAVRDEPGFTQKVAVKLIKRGMDTDEIVRRFVAERQILASLAHPNIARLFDGGSAPDGRPYFVMEYVEGQPITEYVDERKLSIDERLRLFLRVCRAVQHAHQSLVVHRDLKPVNILVDTEGEPKLLDFGIAKLLDPGSFGGMTALTGRTPGPMTPEYASPEQHAGGPVTTATDVYGLGSLLYELLVGHTPRSVERQLGEGWSERPPSQAVAALPPSGNIDRKRHARRLAGDLDTIVGMALEPDPARRYGTAAALAEDIERHLSQMPVAARRPTLAYRLSRTLVRHKLAALLMLAVTLLAAVSSSAYFAVLEERNRAESQRQIAQVLNDVLLRMMQRASPEQNRGETLTVREVLDDGVQEILERDSRYQPETLAALLEATGKTYQKLGLYGQAQRNFRRALQLREALPAQKRETDLALAGALTALGYVCLDQGAFAESRAFFERSLAIKERWLDPADVSLVEDLNGLGTALLEEGDLDRSGLHFERACAISRLEIDGRPRDLAECYNNLGSLAMRREKYTRARVLFSMAFRYFRSTAGEEHTDTMQVRANLAAMLHTTKDHAGAEALMQKIVDLRRRQLKPNHPELARALMDLAIIQREGRRLVEARATLNELMQMRRTYRFPRDRSEAETWNLQGAVAYDLKDLETAEAAFTNSYEIYRTLPGDQRANLSNALNGRAQVQLLRKDPAGALRLARRSLELAQASSSRSGQAMAQTEALLGYCYLALGQPAQARLFLERSHRTLLRLYGPDHPTTRAAADYLRRLGAPAG